MQWSASCWDAASTLWEGLGRTQPWATVTGSVLSARRLLWGLQEGTVLSHCLLQGLPSLRGGGALPCCAVLQSLLPAAVPHHQQGLT